MADLYLRLMHDFQWMPEHLGFRTRMHDPHWNKGFKDEDYPAVVRGFPRSSLAKGDAGYNYPEAWARCLFELNPLHIAEGIRPAGGLFNARTKDKKIPLDLRKYRGDSKAEPVGATGNVYVCVDKTSKAVQLRTFKTADAPPSLSVNYDTAPECISMFTSITKSGKVGKSFGKDFCYPFLSDLGRLWFDRRRVEFFPTLPFKAKVTALPWLNVRTTPDSPDVARRLLRGSELNIISYKPRGSNVWGMLETGEWIALQLFRTFTTSWRMATQPPIPPREVYPWVTR